MTNEQLYLLLSAYRDKLLQINYRHDICSEGAAAVFAGEIDRMADEIQKDMIVLVPLCRIKPL